MPPVEYVLSSPVVQDKTLGYLYFMDKVHPLCDAKGRVWHHRHVASVKVGRWVLPTEVVHHVDHVRDNNEAENLKVLTSQAEHGEEHVQLDPAECPSCRAVFQPKNSRQRACSVPCKGRLKRKFNPDEDELRKAVWSMPTTHVARFYGVSDTAVAKRCRCLGIEKPPRGYWAKSGA